MSQSNSRALVSIGLPTRNSLQFLEERIETIVNQTYQNWELIVVDGESQDGTWERLQKLAQVDSRVRLESRSPDGIYPAFNRCIELAQGEYVYIATSDDTMALNCIEKLTEALETNADCDIAHCPQRVLNAEGDQEEGWWAHTSSFKRSAPAWIHRRHKRIAPHDGIVCILGDNIYSSVTQLLIRKTLYRRIGHYPTQFGSMGDFYWNLRAALAASCVHVPETWGGWRMHDAQATAQVDFESDAYYTRIDAMIREAVATVDSYLDAPTAHLVRMLESGRSREARHFLRNFGKNSKFLRRQFTCVLALLKGNRAAFDYYRSRFSKNARWPQGAPEAVKTWSPKLSLHLLD